MSRAEHVNQKNGNTGRVDPTEDAPSVAPVEPISSAFTSSNEVSFSRLSSASKFNFNSIFSFFSHPLTYVVNQRLLRQFLSFFAITLTLTYFSSK